MINLKEWHKEQIEILKDKFDIKETLELYNKCGVSRATVSLWTSNKNTSKEYLNRKYKDMILNYYAELSPIELIDRIEQEQNKNLSIEIEKLKAEQTKLFIENNQLKEIMNNIQIELEKRD